MVDTSKGTSIFSSSLFDNFTQPQNQPDTGCYDSSHTDEPVPGLHDGFHTLGCRWSDTNGGLLEFFYDGRKIREINDPNLVSRAATYFILSAEVFTDPDWKSWNFVDGDAYNIPLEDFPFYHYVDYVRVWRETTELQPV